MNLLNKLVVAAVPLVPRRIIRYFAGRYIAGETLSMAVDCVRGLNKEGVCATMDVLGEDISTRAEAVAARDECITVLHTIAKEHLDSNLSIKLTSLRLAIFKLEAKPAWRVPKNSPGPRCCRSRSASTKPSFDSAIA